MSCVVLVGCGGGGGGGGGGSQGTVTAVALTASSTALAPGETATLTATVTGTGTFSSALSWSVSPGGATLAPGGATATFSATAPGAYTVTATSQADASRSASVALTVAPAAGGCPPVTTELTHSTSITADETWAGPGYAHVVSSDVTIYAPATVTVEACAEVRLKPGKSITVRGDVAGGTTARLVTRGIDDVRFVKFTRFDPTQAWGQIRGYNERSEVELHWTLLEGGGALGGSMGDATIAMSGPGYFVPTRATLKVDNVAVDQSHGVGIWLDTNSAFSPDSQQLAVANSGTRPLAMGLMSLGSIPAGDFLNMGNAIEETLVFGANTTVFADLTIPKRLPIRFKSDRLTVVPTASGVASVTLTLEAGVEIRFEKFSATQTGALVKFGENGQTANRAGVLVARGTAADPIVFTSGESVPAPGDWAGLWLDTSPGSRLDHVVIEYAGGSNGIVSANCKPGTEDEAALVVGDFDVQYVPPADLITNSTIRFSAGYGINAVWSAPAFSPVLTGGNTFASNAGCNQTWNRLTGASCPAGGGCQP